MGKNILTAGQPEPLMKSLKVVHDSLSKYCHFIRNTHCDSYLVKSDSLLVWIIHKNTVQGTITDKSSFLSFRTKAVFIRAWLIYRMTSELLHCQWLVLHPKLQVIHMDLFSLLMKMVCFIFLELVIEIYSFFMYWRDECSLSIIHEDIIDHRSYIPKL